MENTYQALPNAEKLKGIFAPYIDQCHVNDAVYNALADAIKAGLFPAGTRLSSTKLANVLEISRTPVKIALVRLECDGLIRADQSHRYITYKYNFHEGRDFNEYMLGMYMFACRLAFKKGPDVYYRNLLAKRLDQLDHEPDYANYLETENGFHRIIVQSTNNMELLNAFDYITRKGTVMDMHYDNEILARDFIKNHQPLNRNLYEAIIGNDIMALDEAIEKHNEFMMLHVCNWISENPF